MPDHCRVLWLSHGRFPSDPVDLQRYNQPLSPTLSDWDITHTPNHWSNEQTMVQYTKNIIMPYVAARRASFKEDTPALVIINNFKGQITSAVSELLEANNIHVVLLPANMTDSLQPSL